MIDKCQLPYSFASGRRVSNEMYVMIPATVAIKNPTKKFGINNPNTNIPTNAPIGSVIPDNAAYSIAYLFLPVK